MKFPPPVAELVGLELVRASGGTSEMTLDVTERHENPMGTVHGGILCDLADAAMGTAYFSELEEGESFTTLELKINFLRPFRKGKLVARGRVVHRGRTVGMAECDVEDAEGRLIARASSTCMTLRGDSARGR
ncbi:MAG: PaaI family thioesterase [Thermoleophilia bacterium]